MRYIKIIGVVVGVIIVGFLVFNKYYLVKHYYHFAVSGNSMQELGFNNGETLWAKYGDCNIGNICVFQCNSSKCGGLELIKQVKDKKDGCYWMEGNPSGKDTADSRNFGWLCDNELRIIGVVK